MTGRVDSGDWTSPKKFLAVTVSGLGGDSRRRPLHIVLVEPLCWRGIISCQPESRRLILDQSVSLSRHNDAQHGNQKGYAQGRPR